MIDDAPIPSISEAARRAAPLAALNVAQAQLPQVYEEARAALTECARVDECKSWADKTAALASYARQSGDQELEKMAMRIRARAIQRCGELLREFDARGGDQESKKAGDRLFGRLQAAADAGLSDHQCKDATAVASIPRELFDRMIDAEDPPNIPQLVRAARDLDRAPPPMVTIDAPPLRRVPLHVWASTLQDFEPSHAANCIAPAERTAEAGRVRFLLAWMERYLFEVTRYET